MSLDNVLIAGLKAGQLAVRRVQIGGVLVKVTATWGTGAVRGTQAVDLYLQHQQV